MIASVLPEMPAKLIAAILAAAAIVIFAAARSAENRFERFLAAGFGASIAWGAYLAAIRGTRGGGQVHNISWFTLTTIALGLVIAAVIAGPAPLQRIFALGLVIVFGREWWESLSSLACGTFLGFGGCRVNLQLPNVLSLLLVLAGLTLMIVAAAMWSGDLAPGRWVLLAIAASEVSHIYFNVIAVLNQAPQLRVIGLVYLFCFGASLAFALRAMQERGRRATVLLGAGIMLVALPAIWSGLQLATASSAPF